MIAEDDIKEIDLKLITDNINVVLESQRLDKKIKFLPKYRNNDESIF